jgi:phosphatidylserine synthase
MIFGGGSPNIVAPYPILLVFLAFEGMPLPIVLAAFLAFFWLWSVQLFRGKPGVPRRTVILMVITAGLSIAYFVTSWDYGLRYQGMTYNVVCALASALLLVGCALVFWRARKHASFGKSLLLHTLLFAWLASYAFPYLGETP